MICVDVRQAGLLELRVHEVLFIVDFVEFLGMACLGLDVATQIAIGALLLIVLEVRRPDLQHFLLLWQLP